MGVHLDLPTSSYTIYVEGVIVLVLDCFLFVESEVTLEEFLPLTPLWEYCCFVGVHLDLPTSSCTVFVEGVIILVLDCFLFVESEVTRKEFPPIIVSPRTYFQKTCLFVAYL